MKPLLLLLFTTIAAHSAVILSGSFNLFEGDDKGLVDINWSVIEEDDTRYFCIDNDGLDGVVTTVYFESHSTPSSTSSSFTLDRPVGNLPGGNNINFMETFSLSAGNPKLKNGIDVGESVCFELSQLTPYRVGVHVQSVSPQDYSSSYVAVIPEPSTSILLGIGGVLLLLRKR